MWDGWRTAFLVCLTLPGTYSGEEVAWECLSRKSWKQSSLVHICLSHFDFLKARYILASGWVRNVYWTSDPSWHSRESFQLGIQTPIWNFGGFSSALCVTAHHYYLRQNDSAFFPRKSLRCRFFLIILELCNSLYNKLCAIIICH